MFKAYKKFWQNALKAEGVASRSDYWWVFLVNSIIRGLILLIEFVVIMESFLSKLPANPSDSEIIRIANEIISKPSQSMLIITIIYTLFNLVIMLPVATLTARRLRDAGLSATFAYPLPAIYIGNALLQFVNLSGLNFVSSFFLLYTVILLGLCLRPTKLK
ncbi:MAG: DUF805 domain-containing protein [Streptococcaceae bacterium]|jgi:uncharacterized membrane protein YhaH (DUF805 family)|nr:DUF805 domain-containing protein [Streptococcaceae bacterium]